MASYAGASAEREQKLIEANTETHKSTGEGIVSSASSHSLFTQAVQRTKDAQENKARDAGEVKFDKLIKAFCTNNLAGGKTELA